MNCEEIYGNKIIELYPKDLIDGKYICPIKVIIQDLTNKKTTEIIKDPNFDGLYFTDGYQGEILVNAMHKKIIGKKLTGYFAMKPDLSNMDRVINSVVSAWKQQATEQGIRDFNNFLKLMYTEDVE